MANGSFEQPQIGPGPVFEVVGGTSWTSTNGSGVEIWRTGHNGVASPAGSQHAELNVSGATTYSQAIAVVPGTTYRWSFQHRGRYGAESVEVSVDGTVVATATTGQQWTSYEGTYVAQSNQVVLAFRSLNDGGGGNLLDQIAFRPYG